jgi:hypothetical protein
MDESRAYEASGFERQLPETTVRQRTRRSTGDGFEAPPRGYGSPAEALAEASADSRKPGVRSRFLWGERKVARRDADAKRR